MSTADPAAGHDPSKCGAEKTEARGGGYCGLPAGWGTDHPGVGRCRKHLGNTKNHVVAAEREIARQEVARLGLRVDTTATEALLEEVRRTAANVMFYEALVGELPTHPDDDKFHPSEGEMDEWWERGKPSVYGRTYHVSGTPTGEAKPHVLVQLYMDERKHLTQVTTAALKANVDERHVQLAARLVDAQAATMGAVLMHFARTLGLQDDPRLPAAARAAFESVDSTAVELTEGQEAA